MADRKNPEDVWGDRADRLVESATYHPWRFVGKIVLIFVALSLVFGVVGFATDWFGTAVDIVRPENVKEQYSFFYETINDLKSEAGQVCIAEEAAAAAKGTDVYDQRLSQVIVLKQNYQRIAARYNARAENVFTGKVVRPRDLPATAPTLEQSQALVC